MKAELKSASIGYGGLCAMQTIGTVTTGIRVMELSCVVNLDTKIGVHTITLLD